MLIENHRVLIEFKTWIHDGKILEKKICNIILDDIVIFEYINQFKKKNMFEF